MTWYDTRSSSLALKFHLNVTVFDVCIIWLWGRWKIRHFSSLQKFATDVTLTPSGHEFHHLCWPQDLVPLPVTRVLRFWKTGGGVILLLWLSPHLICGIVLCQNGHDGPQFHPPLRFRWSPVKERWSLVIRHQQINVDWGGQWAPKFKVGDVLDVRNRLELVGSRPHPQ